MQISKAENLSPSFAYLSSFIFSHVTIICMHTIAHLPLSYSPTNFYLLIQFRHKTLFVLQFITSEKWIYIGRLINCIEKEEKWANKTFLSQFALTLHSTIELASILSSFRAWKERKEIESLKLSCYTFFTSCCFSRYDLSLRRLIWAF